MMGLQVTYGPAAAVEINDQGALGRAVIHPRCQRAFTTSTVSTIFPSFNFAKCAIIFYEVYVPFAVNFIIVKSPSVVIVGEPVVVPV